ncbi:hypothetical protein E3U55_14585 [Filobacillus milosensis]|uniref:Lipoprotein n=1 Tax=Filobacillus milosensis TaxID=94137 RepID=A0A4Y8IG63_9BACI|nr:hypothetical protein [Filobacillus milosensis]TFB14137.1 hypothetical protein E3U55_14585 [Filobacillus milosensis]
MQKKLSVLLIIFLLAGCIGNKTYTWEIDGVKDHVIYVNCSKELNKTDNDFGVECPIEVTDSTNLIDENGNEFTIKDLNKGNKVKVTLTSSLEIKTKGNYKATKIILLK